MPVTEIQQPGRNIKEKALLASALLEADMPSVQVAKAVGISKRTTARLKASQREGKVLEHIDPNAVQRIRATFQDKCLLLSDGLLGTNLYSKAGKAGLGETVQAAYKLAELAGIKQPDRTEHFHAVMLKFSTEQPSVNAVDAAKDSMVVDVHSQDAPNTAELKAE